MLTFKVFLEQMAPKLCDALNYALKKLLTPITLSELSDILQPDWAYAGLVDEIIKRLHCSKDVLQEYKVADFGFYLNQKYTTFGIDILFKHDDVTRPPIYIRVTAIDQINYPADLLNLGEYLSQQMAGGANTSLYCDSSSAELYHQLAHEHHKG